MSIVNKQFIKDFITKDEKFHTSHHATEDFLGGAMICYALAYTFKSKMSVCLGSGSGFIPRLMRQAQRDLGIEKESYTVLVDANMPEAGWGRPDYFEKPTFFTQNFDVQIIKKKTSDALLDLKNAKIDYLHIDADHSYEIAKNDFFEYGKLVNKERFITMHDSFVQTKAGVYKLIQELKNNKDFEVINMQIGMGLAVIKKL